MKNMSKKLDPRIIRTRQFLRDALLKLIPEKGYEAIKIQDITDEAILNRSTFYMHYQNKDDLMNSMMKEVLEDLESIPREKSREETDTEYIERLFHHLFQHVADHHVFYSVMIGERSVAGFTQQMQAYMEAIGLKWMGVRRWNRRPIDPELFISFIGSGFMGMIRWWLLHKMPYPPEYMAKQLLRLTPIGIHQDSGINPDEA